MSLTINDRDLAGAIEHIHGLTKALSDVNGRHERLHKAHDLMHEAHRTHDVAYQAAKAIGRLTPDLENAHKCHKSAAEAARLTRVDHRTNQRTAVGKALGHVNSLLKVLGGGSEVATATDGPVSLPTRLTASDATKSQSRNRVSPFDRLAKSSGSQTRVFKNSVNPMWTGR